MLRRKGLTIALASIPYERSSWQALICVPAEPPGKARTVANS